MIAADLLRALLLATVPFAAIAGVLTIWQLYVVLTLTSVCTVCSTSPIDRTCHRSSPARKS